ncbi:deoxyribodipyrimidine photo-lyase [Colwellia asteriadis]|uniref:Deoxyribodipyrimidine photo-lyase n=1 Tax=Colwellia asteriadis TaxID=517723 RepID=A0ABN1L539_9GAMM
MLLWFRNDIRTHDNPALHYFISQQRDNKISKAVFFVSEKQWRLHDWSTIKIDLIKRHLTLLSDELALLNIELLLVDLDSFDEQTDFLQRYCTEHNITEVVANSEVEYNEKIRDEKCIQLGIPLTLFEADVIVPKGKVLTKTGEMYKVFTPFKRAWLSHVKDYGFEYLGKATPNKPSTTKNTISQSPVEEATSPSAQWPLINTIERQVIPTFLNEKVHSYNSQRDIPSIKGTSGLSPYLAIGAVSPRYLLTLLINQFPDILTATDTEHFTWLNELIWREFYRHLLFHQPRLCKHQCFNEKYQSVRWPNNPELFKAWCLGKTGYPLVDAAMRQLNKTGWMHNRLRMVVASFLTKHLLIDWRWGEKYFMENLIDGDLAANNGGWQWAASTGCDAQPYFRVFNPIRQSERFDPNGDFIRMYLPELNKVPTKHIHFPHTYLANNSLLIEDENRYWPAIVEHKAARLAALDFYK